MNESGRSTRLRQVAVLNELIHELGDSGKIKVQKLSYFLQESKNIPLGYSFRMYHYGPYADEVDNSLQNLRALGLVEIEPDVQGYGYHITPTDTKADRLRNEAKPFRDDIKLVVNLLGDLDASSLELHATVHFVDHLLGTPSAEEVVEGTLTLKPKFSRETIRYAYDSLVDWGFVIGKS